MANEKFKVKFGLAVGDTVATVDGTSGDINTDGSITALQNLDIRGTTTLGNAPADTVTVNGDTQINNALTIGSSNGDTVTVNSQVAGNITFTDNSTTTNRGITGTVGANDYWKYGGGAVGSDQGYAEIATGDNGSEPIYARQYLGGSVAKQVTLLDGSGNTTLAGDLTLGGNGYIYSPTNLALDLTGADVRTPGDLTVDGGDLITGNTTSALFNTVATTLNIGGAATTVSIGANTGTTTVNNDLVADNISIATIDATNIEVTNIKAKDGTAAMTIADSTGAVTVSTNLSVDNINISGNSIISTDTNGNINLTPNGTGKVVNGTTIMGDDSYVLGQLVATRNSAYVPPVSALTTLAGQNGLVIASSSGGLGYGANIAIRYYSGDTTAGTANAAAVAYSNASGTSTTPGGTGTNAVLGTLNYDGYTAGTSNNFASQIATANQGAGTTALTPLQLQTYARQAFTNSTTVTTAVTGASGTGTTATLTFTTQNTGPYFVGQTVTVAGMTPSGYNGTYVLTAVSTSSVSYANATTGFTSGGTIAAANTVTAAGAGFRIRGFANSTNMTVPNRFNFMDLTASALAFKTNTYTFANEVITGSTLTATNYLTLGPTGITAGNVDGVINMVRASGATVGTRPVAFLKNTQTVTAAPATSDGASFRFQTQGSNGTAYNLAQFSGVYSTTGDTALTVDIANGDQTAATMSVVQPFASKLSGTTIRATATPSATPGANTLNDIANFGATTTLLKNATTAATYASISSTGQTFTSTGRMNIIRTTPGTGILLRQQTANTDPVNNDEMDFRLSIAGTVTSSDFARFDGTYKSSGDNEIGMSVSTDSFATDTDKIYVGSRASTKIRATPSGGGTASDILTVTDTNVTSARPFVFPSYTAAAANAITGAVGWQIAITDSGGGGNPNGMMAFWDTTNARWSYIHDNSAV